MPHAVTPARPASRAAPSRSMSSSRSGYTERMSEDWIPAEAAAQAEAVLTAMLTNIRANAALSGALAAHGLTDAMLRGALLPQATAAFTKKINAGWTPKKGWRTPGALAAHAAPVATGADLSDSDADILVWRLLAVDLPDTVLAELGITRAQVLAADPPQHVRTALAWN